MKKRKLGNGVWAVGPLGQIVLSPKERKSRLEHGLSVPYCCSHNLPEGCCKVCEIKSKAVIA